MTGLAPGGEHLRVVMVCPYSLSRPGGVQHQAMGLTAALRALGVDVRLIAPCDGPPPMPGVISVGASVDFESNGSVAPIAMGSAVARRTMTALRSIEPDLVHLHEPLVPGPALTTLLGFSGPMIGTVHISGEYPLGWVRPALPVVARNLEQVCAVSQAAADLGARMLERESVVLWNGIEVDDYANVDPWPSDRPAVLFLGRHEPRKGLAVLLEAWDGLDRDADLWIGGTGPETPMLRRRGPGASWLGFVDEWTKRRLLCGATVYCAPALGGESFGIVLAEAMAARTAIVASSIDGYANVARAEREAVLARPGDADDLRAALQRVLDDDALRARLVDAGHRRAAEFSMQRLAQRYIELYEQMLAARSR